MKKGCTLKNEKFLRNGDIVFSVKGTIGKVGYFNDNRENVIPGQCFLIIRTKDEKVADSLGDCGFYLVNKENGFFVFLNDF